MWCRQAPSGSLPNCTHCNSIKSMSTQLSQFQMNHRFDDVSTMWRQSSLFLTSESQSLIPLVELTMSSILWCLCSLTDWVLEAFDSEAFFAVLASVLGADLVLSCPTLRPNFREPDPGDCLKIINRHPPPLLYESKPSRLNTADPPSKCHIEQTCPRIQGV